MTVEFLEHVSLYAFIIAGIAFGISIFLFFKYKIVTLYAEISEKAARREIEDIKEKNAQERTKTKKISNLTFVKSKKIEKKSMENMELETAPLVKDIDTEVLYSHDYPQENVTNVDKKGGNIFEIEENIVFIHTDKIIL